MCKKQEQSLLPCFSVRDSVSEALKVRIAFGLAQREDPVLLLLLLLLLGLGLGLLLSLLMMMMRHCCFYCYYNSNEAEMFDASIVRHHQQREQHADDDSNGQLESIDFVCLDRCSHCMDEHDCT